VKVISDDRRNASRLNQSRMVRIRPADPQFMEEIRTTMNVSWDGFYFATSMAHYSVGMSVHVTGDVGPNDRKKREDPGTVVRVDILREGRWGVAVRLARDVWRTRIT